MDFFFQVMDLPLADEQNPPFAGSLCGLLCVLSSLSIKIKSFIPVYCHISWIETECALVEPWSSDVLVPDLDLDEIVNIFS